MMIIWYTIRYSLDIDSSSSYVSANQEANLVIL
jgi:hypothetical protein